MQRNDRMWARMRFNSLARCLPEVDDLELQRTGGGNAPAPKGHIRRSRLRYHSNRAPRRNWNGVWYEGVRDDPP